MKRNLAFSACAVAMLALNAPALADDVPQQNQHTSPLMMPAPDSAWYVGTHELFQLACRLDLKQGRYLEHAYNTKIDYTIEGQKLTFTFYDDIMLATGWIDMGSKDHKPNITQKSQDVPDEFADLAGKRVYDISQQCIEPVTDARDAGLPIGYRDPSKGAEIMVDEPLPAVFLGVKHHRRLAK